MKRLLYDGHRKLAFADEEEHVGDAVLFEILVDGAMSLGADGSLEREDLVLLDELADGLGGDGAGVLVVGDEELDLAAVDAAVSR